jgi:hypothetical protein
MDERVLSDDFGFRLGNGKFLILARDIELRSLVIPKFSWGWVGIIAAAATAVGLGSFITRALFLACERESDVPLSVLMAKELDQLLTFPRTNLSRSDRDLCVANTQHFLDMMRAYEEEGTESQSKYLLNDFVDTLYGLWKIGFSGYRTYMALAMLRLAVLRGLIQQMPDALELRQNAENYFLEVRSFHGDMVAFIDQLTQSQIVDLCRNQNPTRSYGSPLVSAEVKRLQVNGAIRATAGPSLDQAGIMTITRSRTSAQVEPAMNGQLQLEPGRLLDHPCIPAAIRTEVARDSTDIGDAIISMMSTYDYGDSGLLRTDTTSVA